MSQSFGSPQWPESYKNDCPGSCLCWPSNQSGFNRDGAVDRAESFTVAAAVITASNTEVLLKCCGAINGWLVSACADHYVVGAAVTGKAALVLAAAAGSGVVTAVGFDDVVFN